MFAFPDGWRDERISTAYSRCDPAEYFVGRRTQKVQCIEALAYRLCLTEIVR